MKELWIIRGWSGSGKTTFANKLWQESVLSGLLALHVESDMFMIDENKQYKFEPAKLKHCHELCQHTAEAAMLND